MKKFEFSSQTLEPFFKKIEELDKVQRLAICIITIGVLGAAFYYLSAAPTWNAIKKYRAEYKSTESKLIVAKKKANRLVRLQNERKMKEFEFRKVMRALPEKREIPSLLTSISQSGQDAGVDFNSFTPKGEVNKGFYGEIPVDIAMTGSYHNTIGFFDRVTSLNRIVNIRNVSMTVKGGKNKSQILISTKCQAVTYKFVEPSDNKKKGKGKKGRRRRK